jgi:hypothetical protein
LEKWRGPIGENQWQNATLPVPNVTMLHQHGAQWHVGNPSSLIILLDFVKIAAEDDPVYDR